MWPSWRTGEKRTGKQKMGGESSEDIERGGVRIRNYVVPKEGVSQCAAHRGRDKRNGEEGTSVGERQDGEAKPHSHRCTEGELRRETKEDGDWWREGGENQAKQLLLSVEGRTGDDIIYDAEQNDGNVEYKLMLTHMTPEKLAHRTTQMKYRLQEGSGVCFYLLGVTDGGRGVGISADCLCGSLDAVEQMAIALSAHPELVHVKQVRGTDGNPKMLRSEKHKTSPFPVIGDSSTCRPNDATTDRLQQTAGQREEKGTGENEDGEGPIVQKADQGTNLATAQDVYQADERRPDGVLRKTEGDKAEQGTLGLHFPGHLSSMFRQKGYPSLDARWIACVRITRFSAEPASPVPRRDEREWTPGGAGEEAGESCREMRVAVLGAHGAGKSSLVAVLADERTLDDGEGSARLQICKHPHEVIVGATSSLHFASLPPSPVAVCRPQPSGVGPCPSSAPVSSPLDQNERFPHRKSSSPVLTSVEDQRFSGRTSPRRTQPGATQAEKADRFGRSSVDNSSAPSSLSPAAACEPGSISSVCQKLGAVQGKDGQEVSSPSPRNSHPPEPSLPASAWLPEDTSLVLDSHETSLSPQTNMAEGGREKKLITDPVRRGKVPRVHEKKGGEKHQVETGPGFHPLFGSSEDEDYDTSSRGGTNLGDLSVTLLKKNGVDERVERRQSGPAVTLLDMAGHPKYMKSSINGLLRECLGHVVLVIDASPEAPSIPAQLQQERLVLATALVLLRLPFVLVLNKWDKRYRTAEGCSGLFDEASSLKAPLLRKNKNAPDRYESSIGLRDSTGKDATSSWGPNSRSVDGTMNGRGECSQVSEKFDAQNRVETIEKEDREKMAEEVLQALVKMLAPASCAIEPFGLLQSSNMVEEVSWGGGIAFQPGEEKRCLSAFGEQVPNGDLSLLPARQSTKQTFAAVSVCERPDREMVTDAPKQQIDCAGQPPHREVASPCGTESTDKHFVMSQGSNDPGSAQRNADANANGRMSCQETVRSQTDVDAAISHNTADGDNKKTETKTRSEAPKEEMKSVRVQETGSGWSDARWDVQRQCEYDESSDTARTSKSEHWSLSEDVRRDLLDRQFCCCANFPALLRTCIVGNQTHEKPVPSSRAIPVSSSPARGGRQKLGQDDSVSFLRCGDVFSVSCVDGRGVEELRRYLQELRLPLFFPACAGHSHRPCFLAPLRGLQTKYGEGGGKYRADGSGRTEGTGRSESPPALPSCRAAKSAAIIWREQHTTRTESARPRHGQKTGGEGTRERNEGDRTTPEELDMKKNPVSVTETDGDEATTHFAEPSCPGTEDSLCFCARRSPVKPSFSLLDSAPFCCVLCRLSDDASFLSSASPSSVFLVSEFFRRNVSAAGRGSEASGWGRPVSALGWDDTEENVFADSSSTPTLSAPRPKPSPFSQSKKDWRESASMTAGRSPEDHPPPGSYLTGESTGTHRTTVGSDPAAVGQQQTVQETSVVLGGILLYGHLAVGDHVFCGPCLSPVPDSKRAGCRTNERHNGKGKEDGSKCSPDCQEEARGEFINRGNTRIRGVSEEKKSPSKERSRGDQGEFREEHPPQNSEGGNAEVDQSEFSVYVESNEKKEYFVHDTSDMKRDAERVQGRESKSDIEKGSEVSTDIIQPRTWWYYRQMRVASLRNSERQPVDFLRASASPIKCSLALVFCQDTTPLDAFPNGSSKSLLVRCRDTSPPRFSEKESDALLQKGGAGDESHAAPKIVRGQRDSVFSERRIGEDVSSASTGAQRKGEQRPDARSSPEPELRTPSEIRNSPLLGTVAQFCDVSMLWFKNKTAWSAHRDSLRRDGRTDGERNGKPIHALTDSSGSQSSHACWYAETKQSKRKVFLHSMGKGGDYCHFRAGMIVLRPPQPTNKEIKEKFRGWGLRNSLLKIQEEVEHEQYSRFVSAPESRGVTTFPSLSSPSALCAAPTPFITPPCSMSGTRGVEGGDLWVMKRDERRQKSGVDKDTSLYCFEDSTPIVSHATHEQGATNSRTSVTVLADDALCSTAVAPRFETNDQTDCVDLLPPSSPALSCLPLPVTTWWCVLHVLAHRSAIRRHAVLVVYAHTIRQAAEVLTILPVSASAVDIRRATTRAASMLRARVCDFKRTREGRTECRATSQWIDDDSQEVAATGKKSRNASVRRKKKRDVADRTEGRLSQRKDGGDEAPRGDGNDVDYPRCLSVRRGHPVTEAERKEVELREVTGERSEIDSSPPSSISPRRAGSLSLAVSETGLVLLHFIAELGAEFLCTGLGLVVSDGVDVQGGLFRRKDIFLCRCSTQISCDLSCSSEGSTAVQ
ncbi:hypothetical protein CSUI_007542 [Cystoisospora suis]|uniref:Elongation factor Tu GTP binding domain-containing protein n=1 Tax=Cystoisospora suis TaxID=483139 RepID=A0A2C6JUB4_9APIC|nr:hypothetical protein CSUI_007542 [Cystoisospora suis]